MEKFTAKCKKWARQSPAFWHTGSKVCTAAKGAFTLTNALEKREQKKTTVFRLENGGFMECKTN